MDCSQLGAGYVVDEQWTNVDFTVDSCTATGASVTWKVTNQMVGTRVFVNGWSATDGAAATMTATVDIAKTSVTGSVAANPRTTPAPVAPGTVLGIWDGKQVSLSSESGVNQLWIAAGRPHVRHVHPHRHVDDSRRRHLSGHGFRLGQWTAGHHRPYLHRHEGRQHLRHCLIPPGRNDGPDIVGPIVVLVAGRIRCGC